MDVQYIDRKSGSLVNEKIYGQKALQFLYGDNILAQLFSLWILPLVARLRWLSWFYGYLQKSPFSARKVAPFVAAYGIDLSECIESSYASFNDFFIRKLKPDARPIDFDPSRAVLPADGRYLVFPDVSKTQGFYVKGQQFDLVTFLQDEPLARNFAEGSLVIARLCPTDYHRFHFPCDGVAGDARSIEGPLFSVSPLALRKRLSILAENKRMVTEIETDRFGLVLYVEIGATFVGAIHQTYTPGKRVVKGGEKGYFSFGGSSVVLLFEKGRIHFDEDLVRNSQKRLETKAFFGESLGIDLLRN
ncbi:MAG: phosphatidylserine decarboxylase [Chlamydiia bacterium]|nr:phosphatidylserine decarboxylase [Chlamydiia bacterium]